MRKILYTICLIVLIFINNLAQSGEDLPELNLRAYGVNIFVTDLKTAEEFYVDKLGFKIRSKKYKSHVIELADENYRLLLIKTEKANKVDFPNEAQTSLALQVNDINSAYKRWKSKGVEIIAGIDTIGIGLAAWFGDPFGNVIAFLEQTVGDVEKFDEPRIYNFGYYFSNIPDARKLFIETLKFPVRTERYFPPALPLANWDGSFGFMLHERKGLQPSDAGYNKDSQVVLVFATDDIESTFRYFNKMGIEIIHSQPFETPFGKYFAFKTKEGVVSEIIAPK